MNTRVPELYLVFGCRSEIGNSSEAGPTLNFTDYFKFNVPIYCPVLIPLDDYSANRLTTQWPQSLHS